LTVTSGAHMRTTCTSIMEYITNLLKDKTLTNDTEFASGRPRTTLDETGTHDDVKGSCGMH